MISQIDYQGTITTTTYNSLGAVASTTRGIGQSQRTDTFEYDLLGRVTRSLSGKGSVALAGASGQTAIDAVWSSYGTKYAYDLAGRRISATVCQQPHDLFLLRQGWPAYTHRQCFR